MSRLAATLLVFILGACGEWLSVAVERSDAAPARAPTSSVVAALPVADFEADVGVVLPIPPRAQAPESPAAGWCGETAIQEGLLHAGLWTSQRLVNRAGRPAQPDLYSRDIPVALDGLGVRYTFYSARKRSFDAFAAWVKEALEAGEPVLAGVKILPTKHPEWGLDHFVLVVGYGSRGLLVNTTWGYRAWVGDRARSTAERKAGAALGGRGETRDRETAHRVRRPHDGSQVLRRTEVLAVGPAAALVRDRNRRRRSN